MYWAVSVPEATLDFFAKLLAHTDASTDQEHVRVIIDSNPKVPNRNLAIAGHGPSPGPVLAQMARHLEQGGAEFVVMVCNTAHAYEADIRAAIAVPFVSMIDEARDCVLRDYPNASAVGVLAADGCRHAGLYETALGQCGREALRLDDAKQEEFMSLIYDIKRGDKSERISKAMYKFGETLIDRGAEIVIAACTEIPLVVCEANFPCALIDTTDVLAGRCVLYAQGEIPLPSAKRFRSAV